MIKKIIVSLASIALLVYSIYYIRNINIYTDAQLNDARIKAVEQARHGEIPAALKKLSILIKYDNKSQALWYDYLSVLHWSDKDEEFFKHLDNVNFLSAPDYFIDTCFSVLRKLDVQNDQKHFEILLEKLLVNKTFIDSSHFNRLYLLSQEKDQKELFLKVLEDKHPEHALLEEVALEKLVALARSEEMDRALILFDQGIESKSSDQKFLAEYVTVNNWAREHEKVVNITPKLNNDELPEYAIKAVADSYQSLNMYDDSIKYYSIIQQRFPEKNYDVKITELEETINNIENERIRKIRDQRAREMAEKERVRKEARRVRIEQEQKAEKLRIEKWFKNASFEDMNEALKLAPYSQKHYTHWQALAAQKRGEQNKNDLEFIEKYLEDHPKDSLLFQDYVVILSWNEHFDQVVQNYKAHASEINGQAYFYEAVAVSAKNIKQYKLSLEAYDKALSLSPNENDLILGKSTVLQLADLPDQAISLLDTLSTEEKSGIDVLFRLADAHRQNSAWGKAIETYNKILAINPHSEKALQNKANVLLEQKLPFMAYEISVNHENALDRETNIAIHSAMNTYNMRLTNDDSDAEKQKLAIKKAQKTNQAYLNLLENGTHTEKDINNAYSDQIRLDYLNRDYAKVIESYRKIQDSAPSYILNEVSSSLLALRQPHEALNIAKLQIEKEPTSYSALSNAYYASLELEDFTSADKYLNQLDTNVPIWFYSEDGKRSIKNPKRESLELMKAMHLAYKNDLESAEKSLLNLVSKAPGNNEYLAHLSTIYRWRGWYSMAQEELNIIDNSESNYLLKDVTQTYLHLDQQKFSLASNEISSFTKAYPDADTVKQINKEWHKSNLNLLSFNTSQTNPKGSTFSSKDRTSGIEWFSKPIADHWRALAFTNHSLAKFGNTDGEITRSGTGLNYRHHWGELTGRIFKVLNSEGIDFSLENTWLLNDYFSMNTTLQTFSDQTPIRAFDSGVSAKSFDTGITYRPNELREYSLNTGIADFSDSNTRYSASASARQTLFRDQHRSLGLAEFAYWQGNNTDTNRSYFNPKSLWSTSAALEYESILTRFYERSLSHNLRFELGLVAQHNFDQKPLYSLDYSQRRQFSDRFAINYGLGYSSTYYDGLNEKGPNINFGLEYKF